MRGSHALSVSERLQYLVTPEIGFDFEIVTVASDGWWHGWHPCIPWSQAQCHHGVSSHSSVSVSTIVSNMSSDSGPASDSEVWKWWLHLVTNGEVKIRSPRPWDWEHRAGGGQESLEELSELWSSNRECCLLRHQSPGVGLTPALPGGWGTNCGVLMLLEPGGH